MKRSSVVTLLRLAIWLPLGAAAGWILFVKAGPGGDSAATDGALIGGFMGFIVSRWFAR
jgi:hypothetical protein